MNIYTYIFAGRGVHIDEHIYIYIYIQGGGCTLMNIYTHILYIYTGGIDEHTCDTIAVCVCVCVRKLKSLEKNTLAQLFPCVATLQLKGVQFGNVVQPQFVEDRHN